MENTELIVRAKMLVGEVLTENQGGSSAGEVASVLSTVKGNIYSGICLDYPCGLGFCAEHAAIAEMLKNRETQIAKIVAVSKKEILFPCGRCRELIVLTDSLNKNTEVIVSQSKTIKLQELLPHHWLKS